ncbi:MAG: hypothetical protein NZZ41_01395 [Candidatus Dojkabacteria bacterium]|nr:hypothetical protein [Candidatus Dojkabacteria bacterium]
MISIDELIKILLGVSISFGILLISFGIFRLFIESSVFIRHLRKSVNNFNNLAELLTKDYQHVKNFVTHSINLSNMLSGLASILINFVLDKQKDKKKGSKESSV